MEDRIIQLETIVALQDKTIEGMNREIFQQQQDISKLTRKLEVMEEKLKDLSEPEEIAGNERPPHW